MLRGASQHNYDKSVGLTSDEFPNDKLAPLSGQGGVFFAHPAVSRGMLCLVWDIEHS
jgi:hypothetical protein